MPNTELIRPSKTFPIQLESPFAVYRFQVDRLQGSRNRIARCPGSPYGIDISQGTCSIPAPHLCLCAHQVYFSQAHQDKVHAAVVVPIGRSMTKLVLGHPETFGVPTSFVGTIHLLFMVDVSHIFIGTRSEERRVG